MSGWFVQAIEGRTLKAVFKLYLVGLACLFIVAQIIRWVSGFQVAYYAIPILACLLVIGQYIYYYYIITHEMHSLTRLPQLRNTLTEMGVIVSIIAILIGLLLPGIQKVREASSRRELENKLRLMGIAILHSKRNGRFPPVANYDKEGRPLLSWRVHLLPYLEAEALSLYSKFHLDEPWDSDHNRKLLDRIPTVYRYPGQESHDVTTRLLAPVGKKTAWRPGQPLGLRDLIRDAFAKILVVEADKQYSVPWTKPEDLAFDPLHPRTGLAPFRRGHPLVLLADGHVISLGEDVTDEQLRNLFDVEAPLTHQND